MLTPLLYFYKKKNFICPKQRPYLQLLAKNQIYQSPFLIKSGNKNQSTQVSLILDKKFGDNILATKIY